jgi:hypothetical protein
MKCFGFCQLIRKNILKIILNSLLGSALPYLQKSLHALKLEDVITKYCYVIQEISHKLFFWSLFAEVCVIMLEVIIVFWATILLFRYSSGATTLSIMTFSAMTFSIITLSVSY